MVCRCFKWKCKRFKYLNCAFLPCPLLIFLLWKRLIFGRVLEGSGCPGSEDHTCLREDISPKGWQWFGFSVLISSEIFPFLQIWDKFKVREGFKLWKMLQGPSSAQNCFLGFSCVFPVQCWSEPKRWKIHCIPTEEVSLVNCPRGPASVRRRRCYGEEVGVLAAANLPSCCGAERWRPCY